MEALSPTTSRKIKKEQIEIKRLSNKKPRASKKSKNDENLAIYIDNNEVENSFTQNTELKSSYACSSPSPININRDSKNLNKLATHNSLKAIENINPVANTSASNISLAEPSLSYPLSPSPIAKVKTINQLLLLADQVKCFKTDLSKFNNDKVELEKKNESIKTLNKSAKDDFNVLSRQYDILNHRKQCLINQASGFNLVIDELNLHNELLKELDEDQLISEFDFSQF